jgi:hypothetical protein
MKKKPAPKTNWTDEQNQYIMKHYAHKSNKELAAELNMPVKVVQDKGSHLGLKKTRFCKATTAHATVWTDEMIDYLKANYLTISNKDLAKHLKLRLTVTRNKMYELGLKRMQLEFWTPEQLNYLVENYRTMGDVEIAENLQQLYPRKKGWSKHHISKKRGYLNLQRTPEEIDVIVSQHHSAGGRMNTIAQNSCSVNLTDNFVANTMSRFNPDLKAELLKRPELIELKRSQIKLNRAIKEHTKKAG